MLFGENKYPCWRLYHHEAFRGGSEFMILVNGIECLRNGRLEIRLGG